MLQHPEELPSIRYGAVLFADICNSTSLFKKLGDENAHLLIKNILQKCEDLAVGVGGTVVKTIGDEIMLQFPDTFSAVSAAVDMQLMQDDFSDGECRIAMRIGLNAGEIQYENGDLFGNTVNLAARFVDYASPGKIITSKALFDKDAMKKNFNYREIGAHKFKGFNDPVECCEVIAESTSLTLIRMPSTQAPPSSLRLEIGERKITVESSDVVTIGRGRDNTIQIESPSISRSHALIEGKQTFFTITDQSTNGTFIIEGGLPAVKIHHETYFLTGEGFIALGSDDETKIKFMVIT